MLREAPQYLMPRFDWRTLLVALLIVTALRVLLHGEPPRWELAMGTVTATSTEASECYITIGPHTMVALHPQSVYCGVARNELIGKRGRLVFLVDP